MKSVQNIPLILTLFGCGLLLSGVAQGQPSDPLAGLLYGVTPLPFPASANPRINDKDQVIAASGSSAGGNLAIQLFLPEADYGLPAGVHNIPLPTRGGQAMDGFQIIDFNINGDFIAEGRIDAALPYTTFWYVRRNGVYSELPRAIPKRINDLGQILLSASSFFPNLGESVLMPDGQHFFANQFWSTAVPHSGFESRSYSIVDIDNFGRLIGYRVDRLTLRSGSGRNSTYQPFIGNTGGALEFIPGLRVGSNEVAPIPNPFTGLPNLASEATFTRVVSAINNKGQMIGTDVETCTQNCSGLFPSGPNSTWVFLPQPDYGLAAGFHRLGPVAAPGGRSLSDDGAWLGNNGAADNLWYRGVVFKPEDRILGSTAVDVQQMQDISLAGTLLARGTINGGPLAFFMLAPAPQIIEVNESGDAADTNPDPDIVDTDPVKPGTQVTLRAAITAANQKAGPQKITFAIPGAAEPVISPLTPLPSITNEVTIDATTQPGTGRVHLQGAAGSAAKGLQISGSNTRVSGMTLTGFSEAAIHFVGGSGHKVDGCYIGTNSAGAAGLGNGTGVKITNALAVIIGGIGEGLRNVISGNGMGIEADGADRLSVFNNLIGTTPGGNAPLQNSAFGVLAKNCGELLLGVPGTTTSIYAPVGVSLQNVGTSTGGFGARIHNLTFNLNSLGQSALGNAMTTGLRIENSAKVTVGGETPDTTNTLGNSLAHGLHVIGSELVDIFSNRLGTGTDGMVSLPLPGTGIRIEGGRKIKIGSSKAQLLLNAATGVHCVNMQPSVPGEAAALLQNIAVNLNQIGQMFAPRPDTGILVENCTGVTVGGHTAGEKNHFAGIQSGVFIKGSSLCQLLGNNFGFSLDGKTSYPITGTAIQLENSQGVTLGSPGLLSRVNAQFGVIAKQLTAAPGGTGNVFGNLAFNLNDTGTASLGTFLKTAFQVEDSQDVTIGGSSTATGNTIASAVVAGIKLERSQRIKALANRIGTSLDGMLPLPVAGHGILVDTCQDIIIGSAEQETLINAKTGVALKNISAGLGNVANLVQNLYLNLNAGGMAPLGTFMDTGISVENSTGLTIGGHFAGARNHLAGIAQAGLKLTNSQFIRVLANNYGFSSDGQFSFPIQGAGIQAESCQDLTLGSPSQVSRIGAQIGVIGRQLSSALGGSGSVIENFEFNLNPAGNAGLGNFMQTALQIEDSTDLTIGGTTAATGNIFGPGPQKAINLLRAKRIQAFFNRIGMSKDGLVSLPVSGIGISAEDCEGLTLGTAAYRLLVNAPTGISLKNVKPSAPGGFGALMQNIHFNLNATGQLAFGPTMTTGLLAENCEKLDIGGQAGGGPNVFAGIQGLGMALKNCGRISTWFNRIGTTADGMSPLPVTGTGILADTCQDIILGTAEQETLINATTGVLFKDLSQSLGGIASLAQNLSFNLNAGGTAALGTAMETAISVENSTGLTIGTSGLGNAIGRVSGAAIDILDSGLINVTGNKIGMTRDGQTPLPVAEDAISVSFTQPAQQTVKIIGNLMNAGVSGVNVKSDGQTTIIRENLISPDETSPPNAPQAFKAIRRVSHPDTSTIGSAERGSTRVQGTIAGRPNAELTLDFYAYPPLSIVPEADIYIGALTVRLDSGGFGSYSRAFPTTAPSGWKLTSTITNDTEGTSELSAPASIAPPPDSDGDGLPDAWEILHAGGCLNPFAPNPISQDCDGDGLTNLQEYAAGSNPLLPDRVPLPETPTVAADGKVSLSMAAVPGRRYTLQRLQTSNPPWVDVTSRYASAAGPLVLQDPIIRSSAIYRILIGVE